MTSSVGPQGINPPEIREFKEFRSDIISGGSGFFEILEGLYLVGGTWLFLAHKLHQELTLAKKRTFYPSCLSHVYLDSVKKVSAVNLD